MESKCWKQWDFGVVSSYWSELMNTPKFIQSGEGSSYWKSVLQDLYGSDANISCRDIYWSDPNHVNAILDYPPCGSMVHYRSCMNRTMTTGTHWSESFLFFIHTSSLLVISNFSRSLKLINIDFKRKWIFGILLASLYNLLYSRKIPSEAKYTCYDEVWPLDTGFLYSDKFAHPSCQFSTTRAIHTIMTREHWIVTFPVY